MRFNWGMHHDMCVAVAAASHGMLSYGDSGLSDAACPLAWSEACPTACRALACLQRCRGEQITAWQQSSSLHSDLLPFC